MLTLNACYTPPERALWKGREDSRRFHNTIECVSINELKPVKTQGIAVLGFASDEGVKRNQGKPGAIEGPSVLRKKLAPLTLNRSDDITLCDVGTLSCLNGELEASQERVGEVVSKLLELNYLPILLGGGHEISWGHYLGLSKTNSLDAFGIINFDAHYDLRPLLPNQQGSSGTPFRQIAEDRKAKNKPFDYLCIGIQETANTQALFETAKEYDVHTVLASQIERAEEEIEKILTRNQQIYLTLCLDVFSAAHAPGVSASQPFGLLPSQVLPLLNLISQSGKVIGFDVAELCPPLDNEFQTARLGSGLIASFISNYKI